MKIILYNTSVSIICPFGQSYLSAIGKAYNVYKIRLGSAQCHECQHFLREVRENNELGYDTVLYCNNTRRPLRSIIKKKLAIVVNTNYSAEEVMGGKMGYEERKKKPL